MCIYMYIYGLPRWLSRKESAWNERDMGLISGSEGSPGGRHGSPLWYSCLENPMESSLVGWSPIGLQRVGFDWSDWAHTDTHVYTHTHTHTHTYLYILFFRFFSLISSVQFSRSVMYNSLWPHELQHTRAPCPSLTPRFHPNPCLLSQWCHPTISFSVIPFSSCSQSFPASGSFQLSPLCASGGQSVGVSASKSVLPKNTQDWSLGWTGWISLQSKGLSRVFSNTTVQKRNSSALSFLHSPTLTSIHDHWKNHSLD